MPCIWQVKKYRPLKGDPTFETQGFRVWRNISSSRKAAGLGFWSWQWSLRFCVDDLRRLRLSTADYPRFLSFLPFLIGFLIPGERLEGQELPQRITSEVRNSDLDSSLIWNVLFFVDTCQAVNTDLQPFPVPAPLQNSHGFTLVYILVSFSEWNRGLLNLSQALRGCCGEPTEHGCLVGETTASSFGLGPNDSMVMLPRFRWLFLDSEKAWGSTWCFYSVGLPSQHKLKDLQNSPSGCGWATFSNHVGCSWFTRATGKGATCRSGMAGACIIPGQARPAACDALRVGVDLSGKAHLSGAAALAEMKCHTNVWGCYFDVKSIIQYTYLFYCLPVKMIHDIVFTVFSSSCGCFKA